MTAAATAELRDVLPTWLGSQGIRDGIAAELRARAFFVSRCGVADILSLVKDLATRMAAGDMDMASARVTLLQAIRAIGYTPAGGFPGTPEGAVPPAVEGTLQDLTSKRRLDLILNTQLDLTKGRGQQLRGLRPGRLEQFPAYELVRLGARAVPRNWHARWTIAGGQAVSGGRLIALKGDPVWGELGGSGNFDDALDVDFPPFAFNSGMGWVEVSAEKCRALGVTGPDGETVDEWLAKSHPLTVGRQDAAMPPPQISMTGIDPALQNALRQLGVDIVDGVAVPQGGADALRARLAARAAARADRAAARISAPATLSAWEKGGVL